MESVQALELLHPRFADREVRSKAVEWIQRLSDDELCDYLPQLVQVSQMLATHILIVLTASANAVQPST